MRDDRELYVYGFAAPGLPAKLTVLRHALRVLGVSDVEAIVAPMTVRPQPTVEALQVQHAVIARLADRVPALLPARFGSIATENNLRRLMTSHHGVLADALERVRDCVQMTIRVFGTPDPAESTDTPPTTGTAFLERRRSRAHQVPPEVETIRRQMSGLTTDERVAPGERSLRVSVFHLVPRSAVEAYQIRASRLHLPPHRVTVTGPMPVFAFAPELL